MDWSKTQSTFTEAIMPTQTNRIAREQNENWAERW